MDFDPAEISGAGQLGKLVQFLAQLARVLSADVIVTHESFKREVFLILHGDE